MARGQLYVEAWQKHLEIYANFSRGINSTTAAESMSDNELSDLDNIDLDDRGALKRRSGMVSHISSPGAGLSQGYFRYFNQGGGFQEILAVGGKFFINGTQKTITGLTGGFQTTKQIEGAQFQDKMYFATGTKLVQFDGSDFSVVEPHKPNPLEALYVGTNGLADDPNNYLDDGVGSTLQIAGVTFDKRYGLMNEETTMTAYHIIPAGTSVEYQFEYRFPFMEDGKWLLGQDWGASKSYTFTAEGAGDMQFRVNMREAGNEVAEAQYLIPKYTIKPAPDPEDEESDTSGIGDCTRIILHWNRLILYGDPTQPDMIYISHLNNPAYFPVPNSLRFETTQREPLTTIVKFRDSLVAFTENSIQALYGKAPQEYRRVVLNTTLGCMAQFGACVVKNYIMFLSRDGVYFLKSLGYVDDKANIEKLDVLVDNLTERDTSATALYFDGQFHLSLPAINRRMRYYFDLRAWTKDTSERFDFARQYVFEGELYAQAQNGGQVFRFDEDTMTDDGFVYADVIETKYFDFGQPYHTKKLKELMVAVSPSDETVTTSVYVYADAANVLGTDQSQAVVDEEGNVTWQPIFEPNMVVHGGSELGQWSMGNSPFGNVESALEKLKVTGRCLRAKVRFEHEEAVPNKFIGLAFIMKLKKP